MQGLDCKLGKFNPSEGGQISYTPPKFDSSPLKNGGWKTILSYWVSVTFRGRAVKLREGKPTCKGV